MLQTSEEVCQMFTLTKSIQISPKKAWIVFVPLLNLKIALKLLSHSVRFRDVWYSEFVLKRLPLSALHSDTLVVGKREPHLSWLFLWQSEVVNVCIPYSSGQIWQQSSLYSFMNLCPVWTVVIHRLQYPRQQVNNTLCFCNRLDFSVRYSALVRLVGFHHRSLSRCIKNIWRVK